MFFLLCSAYLDAPGGDGLLDKSTQNLRALFIVQMVKEEVSLNGMLESLNLLGGLFDEGRGPVVVAVGARLQRLC